MWSQIKEEEQTYKYLGVNKSEVIQHAWMKEKNRKELITVYSHTKDWTKCFK